jgi:hypothetical protein
MAKAMEKRICMSCLKDVEVLSAVNFLGFPKFACPECKEIQKHPLATARKSVYQILVLAVGAYCVYVFSQGGIPMPGIIAILLIISVVEDLAVTAKLKDAKRRQEAAKRSPGPVYLNNAG